MTLIFYAFTTWCKNNFSLYKNIKTQYKEGNWQRKLLHLSHLFPSYTTKSIKIVDNYFHDQFVANEFAVLAIHKCWKVMNLMATWSKVTFVHLRLLLEIYHHSVLLQYGADYHCIVHLSVYCPFCQNGHLWKYPYTDSANKTTSKMLEKLTKLWFFFFCYKFIFFSFTVIFIFRLQKSFCPISD